MFTQPQTTIDVSVPAGQSIAISSFGGGVAKISYSTDPSAFPRSFYENSRLDNASAVYGPFASDRAVRIEAGLCELEYVIAVSPVLTRKPFNRDVTGALGGVSSLGVNFTDSTGTPGNVTNNSPRGRVAFAAAATAVTVTNSLVTAASMVIATLRTADGTLTQILRATPAAGSFTLTANAASTGTAAQADFLVVG